MQEINTVLKQFRGIATNPYKTMKGCQAETGRGTTGIMPLYSSEELIHATDYLSMGLWGASHPVTKVRAYPPAFACSIMQQVAELKCEGTYDDLAAVVLPAPCDTLKCMSQKWEGKSPVLVFTHPQNGGLEPANHFLEQGYLILKGKLEKVTGVQIINATLENPTHAYNENRTVVRKFPQLAAQYPQLISAINRHVVFKSRMSVEKSRHTAMVRSLIDALKAIEPQPWDDRKTILTGILVEPDGPLEIFDQLKLAVATGDFAQKPRQIRADIPEEDETPLYRLARA